jgi:hypothetical protein
VAILTRDVHAACKRDPFIDNHGLYVVTGKPGILRLPNVYP